MKRHTLLLGLALAFAASTASAATPPPTAYNSYVKLCNLRLHAKVDIMFHQSTNTASVLAQARPVDYNPALITAGGNYAYSIVTETQSKPSSNHPWSAVYSNTQVGIAGNAQPDVSASDSIFKNYGCQLRGAVTITTQCPAVSGMSSDTKRIERTWTDCGP